MDLLAQLDGFTPGEQVVTEAHVFECFCRGHNTPRFLVDPRISLDLAELEAEFHQCVLGQAEAIKAVVGRIGMIKAGLLDIQRPFGSFLFVGPTGVGKTLLAREMDKTFFMM